MNRPAVSELRLSVVIPVFEHWHTVAALIQALAAQTLSAERFDVWLVDNGSRNFAPPGNPPANVNILRCETPGSYAARNHGLRHATGDWIVFTDADCRPQPDWLEQLAATAAAAGARQALVAGLVRMVSASRYPNWYEAYDLVKGIPQRWYVTRGYAATANLAVRADLFQKVGLFDPSRFSGGDADFCRRATRAGHSIALCNSAIVEHAARASWRELNQKARRLKGAQLRSGRKRDRLVHWIRTFVPPIIAVVRFLRSPQQPARLRLIAILVQHRIWLYEMLEAFRIVVLGAAAERR